MFVADSLKKSKQRFGEFKFEYFGGSDVANKLFECTKCKASFVLKTILKDFT